MQVEKINNEIVIKVASETNLIGLQRILDYIKFRETASKSKASQVQIDDLAYRSKSSWWKDNKSRFVQ